ncbi:hypothetical protein OAL39_00410 [bacterium]|nr:hypothetical protein [bacterium]
MGRDNEGKLIVSLSQYLGLIAMMSCLFLGMTYWTDGNLIASVPVTVILAAVIFILINYFIKEKVVITRGGYRTSTILLFFIYLALSIPVSVICLHAVNVEVFEKDNIQKIGKTRIACLNMMEEVYNEKKDNIMIDWTAELNSNISTYLSTKSASSKAILEAEPYLLPVEDIDASNKSRMISEWTNQMNRSFDDGFNSIHEKSAQIISKSNKALKNWDRFNVNNQFNKLDNHVITAKKEMDVAFIDITRRDMNLNISSYIKEKSLLTQPIELFKKHLNPISFIFIILIQLLILLPYFLTPKPIYNKEKKKKKRDVGYTDHSSDEITGTSL